MSRDVRARTLKRRSPARSLKCCTFPSHSHPSICHPSITAQPYHSCDRLSGPWRVLTYLLPSNIPAHWCMQKSPLTPRHELMERHNHPVGLPSAQWIALLLQFLAECHRILSGPRTAPDTLFMPVCGQLGCCLAICSGTPHFLKEDKNNTLCHHNNGGESLSSNLQMHQHILNIHRLDSAVY